MIPKSMETHKKRKWLCVLFFPIILIACGDDTNTLAPYQGQRDLSEIQVESNTFTPGITWVGGYVAALGVNRGEKARLDSSLVWLITTDGNNIRFPVTFGDVPTGAQERAGDYGGQVIESLVEDNVYTYWLLQEEAWQQVSGNNGKMLFENGSATSATVEVRGDTVFIDTENHTQLTQSLDVFVNIADARAFGRLGAVTITEPKSSSDLVITWNITQTGIEDSLVAAMGIVEGQQYQSDNVVWEVWSEEVVNEQAVYGSKNVIQAPVVLGESLPETRVFTEFPEEGLQRDRNYYVWIAHKDWDGEGRLRSTSFYAYTTFRTW